ncbi:MAG: hemin ABC transporter ATP-binding protein, partial [Microbacteriaceae bacterium]
RVLAQRTGIVMLDEPTAALDLKHQEAVLRIARERAAAGDAVVIVLHDLNLAAAYADRVALLADGRLHSAGAPEQVLTAETIAEVYQHPVEIVRHPRTGRAIVVPLRD